MYLIVSGAVFALFEHEGETHPLDEMLKGDFFGEISLLSGAPRSASVRATTHSELLVVGRLERGVEEMQREC